MMMHAKKSTATRRMALTGPAGGYVELLPNRGRPAPRLGTNPRIGLESVLASASTCTPDTHVPGGIAYDPQERYLSPLLKK